MNSQPNEIMTNILSRLYGRYIKCLMRPDPEIPRDVAYARLKLITGEDFGYDARAWRRWFKRNDAQTALKGLIQFNQQYQQVNTK